MNTTFQAQITKVAGKATTDKGGAIRRFCTVELLREFDGDIADEIGPGARKLLRPIVDLEVKKADVAIDALHVNLTVEATEADGLKRSVSFVAHGVAAKIKGGQEDRSPTVKLVFRFPYDEAAWSFLGRNYASHAKVVSTPAQGELPLASNGGEKQEGRRGRKAKQTEETVTEAH